VTAAGGATAFEYSLLVAYAGVAYAATYVLVDALPAERAVLWPVLVAATALSLRTVRRAARRFSRRIFGSATRTPYGALTQLTHELSRSASLDDALPRLARMLRECTPARRADVWLVVAGRLVRTASAPMKPDNLVAVDLRDLSDRADVDHVSPVYRGAELLGALTLGLPTRTFITAVDVRLMNDAANTAGIALDNARLLAELQAQLDRTAMLAEELRAARRGLVAARDDTRQRLVETIRATALVALEGLAAEASTIRWLLESDPAAARDQLGLTQAGTDELIRRFRAVVHGASQESSLDPAGRVWANDAGETDDRPALVER
jgi:hypothetical protein